MLNEKNSLNLNVGIPIGTSFNETLSKELVGDNYSIDKATLSNFHIRGAYRHYTGKHVAPKGFYYEPSLKYQTLNPHISANGSVTIEERTEEGNVALDASISSFSAGFQIGYQFLIAERVTIDLGFFGLEAGMWKVKMDASSDNTALVDNFEQDITSAVEDLPFGNPTVTREGDTFKVKTESIFLPMLRFNIGIGFAF